MTAGIPMWALIGVFVSVMVITTALFSTTLIIWCSIIRKKLTKSKENTIQRHVTDNSAISQHSTDTFNQSDNRRSDHIYSVPRWSNGSMMYNQAYQESFVLTINSAYSSSTEK